MFLAPGAPGLLRVVRGERGVGAHSFAIALASTLHRESPDVVLVTPDGEALARELELDLERRKDRLEGRLPDGVSLVVPGLSGTRAALATLHDRRVVVLGPGEGLAVRFGRAWKAPDESPRTVLNVLRLPEGGFKATPTSPGRSRDVVAAPWAPWERALRVPFEPQLSRRGARIEPARRWSRVVTGVVRDAAERALRLLRGQGRAVRLPDSSVAEGVARCREQVNQGPPDVVVAAGRGTLAAAAWCGRGQEGLAALEAQASEVETAWTRWLFGSAVLAPLVDRVGGVRHVLDLTIPLLVPGPDGQPVLQGSLADVVVGERRRRGPADLDAIARRALGE